MYDVMLAWLYNSHISGLDVSMCRRKVETLVGNTTPETSKSFEMLVQAGEEPVAEELIKFMYCEEITLAEGSIIIGPVQAVHVKQGPYTNTRNTTQFCVSEGTYFSYNQNCSCRYLKVSRLSFAGEDVAKLLTLAHQFLVQSCEARCLQMLLEVIPESRDYASFQHYFLVNPLVSALLYIKYCESSILQFRRNEVVL